MKSTGTKVFQDRRWLDGTNSIFHSSSNCHADCAGEFVSRGKEKSHQEGDQMIICIWIYLLAQAALFCWAIHKRPIVYVYFSIPYYIITILLLLKAYSLV